MKLTKTELTKLIKESMTEAVPDNPAHKRPSNIGLYYTRSFGDEKLSPEQIEDFAAEIADEVKATDVRSDIVAHRKMRKLGIAPATDDFIRLMDRVDSLLYPDRLKESYVRQVIREEYQAVLDEKKKKRKKKKKKSAKDKMKCNSPRRIRKGEAGHGKKKFVVKACDGGTEKIIRYGDAGLKIKRKQKGRRKNFRARHNCDNPGSKLKARYWSCKNW